MNHRLLCKLIVSLALGAALTAQAASDGTNSPKLEKLAPDIGSTSVIANHGSSVAVESGTDKSSATVKLFQEWAPDPAKLIGVALIGKTPFESDKDDKRDLGDLNGLTAGSSLKLQVSYLNWPVATVSDTKSQLEVCSEAIAEIFPGYFMAIDRLDDPKNLLSSGNDTDCPIILESDKFKSLIAMINVDRQGKYVSDLEEYKQAVNSHAKLSRFSAF